LADAVVKCAAPGCENEFKPVSKRHLCCSRYCGDAVRKLKAAEGAKPCKCGCGKKCKTEKADYLPGHAIRANRGNLRTPGLSTSYRNKLHALPLTVTVPCGAVFTGSVADGVTKRAEVHRVGDDQGQSYCELCEEVLAGSKVERA
jgi:hypothetical protein